MFEALLYDLLYTRVLGIEEEDLHTVLDEFREGGERHYRNNPSGCSEKAAYDLLEDSPPRSLHQCLFWFTPKRAVGRRVQVYNDQENVSAL